MYIVMSIAETSQISEDGIYPPSPLEEFPILIPISLIYSAIILVDIYTLSYSHIR